MFTKYRKYKKPNTTLFPSQQESSDGHFVPIWALKQRTVNGILSCCSPYFGLFLPVAKWLTAGRDIPGATARSTAVPNLF
jgi:hypothetical protein